MEEKNEKGVLSMSKYKVTIIADEDIIDELASYPDSRLIFTDEPSPVFDTNFDYLEGLSYRLNKQLDEQGFVTRYDVMKALGFYDDQYDPFTEDMKQRDKKIVWVKKED